jgi:hypothetical protein
MKLPHSRPRALRAIERDLADSDPGLGELFSSFTLRTNGQNMPRLETMRARPTRQVTNHGQRADPSGAAESWRARLWKILHGSIALAMMSNFHVRSRRLYHWGSGRR